MGNGFLFLCDDFYSNTKLNCQNAIEYERASSNFVVVFVCFVKHVS